MGFRSTFISEHVRVDWTDEWKASSPPGVAVTDYGVVYSTCEQKLYTNEVFEWVQRGLIEAEFFSERKRPFLMIVIHECGGAVRVDIYEDKILRGRPPRGTEWNEEDMHGDGCLSRPIGPEHSRWGCDPVIESEDVAFDAYSRATSTWEEPDCDPRDGLPYDGRP